MERSKGGDPPKGQSDPKMTDTPLPKCQGDPHRAVQGSHLEVEDAGIALLEALPMRHHPVQERWVQCQRGDGRQQPAVPCGQTSPVGHQRHRAALTTLYSTV